MPPRVTFAFGNEWWPSSHTAKQKGRGSRLPRAPASVGEGLLPAPPPRPPMEVLAPGTSDRTSVGEVARSPLHLGPDRPSPPRGEHAEVAIRGTELTPCHPPEGGRTQLDQRPLSKEGVVGVGAALGVLGSSLEIQSHRWQ